MPSYDVIIPARNEEPTVGAVVRAARQSRGVGRVIVVDDHSTDATAERAREAGAEVIASQGDGNKALALATGVAASDASVLLFFDSDILGARGEHFDALAAPVLDGGFAMSCGWIDYGRRGRLYMRFPPITGLRAIRREIFEGIAPDRINGFQIEMMMNAVVARRGLRTAAQMLAGVRHRTKVDKLGWRRGSWAQVTMILELLEGYAVMATVYGNYLSNLTVLD